MRRIGDNISKGGVVMKNIFRRSLEVFCSAVCCVILLSASANAHPPRSVSAVYDGNGSLSVSIDHPVNDPSKHFINTITIYKNGAVVAKRELDDQPRADGLSDSFAVGVLAPGTIIRVEVSCVIMGTSFCEVKI